VSVSTSAPVEPSEDRILIKYLNPSRADREQTVWLGNFDVQQTPVHNGIQCVPHEPVVAEWLFFPHPVYRQDVLLRFAKKTPVTLNFPTLYPQSVGQAAVHVPMRSGEEVTMSFTRDTPVEGLSLCLHSLSAHPTGSN
jgi:hypothetical protein